MDWCPDEEQRSGWQPQDGLLWIQYEDGSDWVVYNPLSSEVHLVNDSARRLWELLSDGRPRSIPELLASIRSLDTDPEDAAAIGLTRDTLEFMDEVGLIRPII
jgi:PqqD family protein of HPr-rel-A system